MKNYKELLHKLINKSLGEKDFLALKKDFKSLFKKGLKTYFSPDTEKLFHKFYGPDYLEVLSQELFTRILAKKETILSLDYLHEKYLLTMAINIIYYHLASEFQMLRHEVNFEDLYQSEDPDERELKLEENLPKIFINYLEDLEINHLVKVIRSTLSQKELETLCWYVSKNVYQNDPLALAKLTKKNHLYKRWERLKPKLNKVLPKELFENRQRIYKFFEVIRSEICQKLHLIEK